MQSPRPASPGARPVHRGPDPRTAVGFPGGLQPDGRAGQRDRGLRRGMERADAGRVPRRGGVHRAGAGLGARPPRRVPAGVYEPGGPLAERHRHPGDQPNRAGAAVALPVGRYGRESPPRGRWRRCVLGDERLVLLCGRDPDRGERAVHPPPGLRRRVLAGDVHRARHRAQRQRVSVPAQRLGDRHDPLGQPGHLAGCGGDPVRVWHPRLRPDVSDPDLHGAGPRLRWKGPGVAVQRRERAARARRVDRHRLLAGGRL